MITRANDTTGVTSVVGELLLIAITVVFAASLLTASQSIINDLSQPTPTADVDYDRSNDQLLLRDLGNSDKVIIVYSDDTRENFTDEGVYTLNGGSKPYQIIAEKEQKQILIQSITS